MGKHQFPGTGESVKGDAAFHLTAGDEVGFHIQAPETVELASDFIQQDKLIWSDLDGVHPGVFQPDIKFSITQNFHGQQYLLVPLEDSKIPVLKLPDFFTIQSQCLPLSLFLLVSFFIEGDLLLVFGIFRIELQQILVDAQVIERIFRR